MKGVGAGMRGLGTLGIAVALPMDRRMAVLIYQPNHPLFLPAEQGEA